MRYFSYYRLHRRLKHGGKLLQQDYLHPQGTGPLFWFLMATFGWSYKSNASGSKRPSEQSRKVESWQEKRADDTPKPLHPQSHSAETLTAGTQPARKKCKSLKTDYLSQVKILATYFSSKHLGNLK